MRIIFCGSRDWEGIEPAERIHRVLVACEIMATALSSPLQIVHGGCPTGADAIVDRWARRRGYEVIVYEANWWGHGRNARVALDGGDLCIGFLKGDSRGTIDMTERAKAQRIPTFIIDWDQGDEA